MYDSVCVESAKSDTRVLDSTEIAFDLSTSVSSFNLKKCRDIKHRNLFETTQSLRHNEQKALLSSSTPSHDLFSRLSSVPLHDCSRVNDFCRGRARFEITISHFDRSRSDSRIFRASTQYQFCQDNRLYISQSAIKKNELHRFVLDFIVFDKKNDRRRQQQRQRKKKKNIDDSNNNDDEQSQREADIVIETLTIIENGRICSSRKKEKSLRSSK